jgi:hypothetical protein
MAKTTKVIVAIVVILVVGIGVRAMTLTKKTVPSFAAKLASCKAFPNDSK